VQDLTSTVQRLHTALTDLAGLFWGEYERTDSNSARAKAQGVSELADDLLAVTGITAEACLSDLLDEMRASATTTETTEEGSP
jgi:hypothetical protein